MTAAAWFDAHAHPGAAGEDAAAFRRRAEASGLGGMAVMAVREADWGKLAATGTAGGGFFRVGFGVHPWAAAEAGDPAALGERLAAALAAHPGAGVGEIGLDGGGRGPPMDVQEAVFRVQWEVARRMGRPVSVHGYKAWERIFAAMREAPNPAGAVLHAYGGPAGAAKEFAGQAVWVSFGRAGLREGARKAAALAAAMPPERCLAESDAETPADALSALAVVDRLAMLWGKTRDEVAETLAANFRSAFGG